MLAALAAGIAGCNQPPSCDTHGPNLPAGASTDSNFLGRCEFTKDTTWHSADGTLVFHYNKGARYFERCARHGETSSCFAACTQLAENFGVADTNAACTNTTVRDDLETPRGGLCSYLQLCNPGDFPLPEPAPAPAPEPEPTATLYCAAGVAPPASAPCHPPEPGALWWHDADFGCGSQSPTSPCGFPVSGVEPGDDPDAQCVTACKTQILHNYSDGDPEDPATNNCDTFVQAEVCMAGVAPGFGSRFTWTTASGTTAAPLACDGACCAEVGFGACANLASGAVLAPAAKLQAPLTLPVQLVANGVVSTGTVVGTIAYAKATCAAGATCPLYVESLRLSAPAPLRGVWVQPSGARAAFTIDQLTITSTRPALGGYRAATGQLQLRAGSLGVEVRATVDARSVGWVSASVVLPAGNARVITGQLASNSVTLATTFDLAPGVRLTVGMPGSP